jgi:hypothetical protein
MTDRVEEMLASDGHVWREELGAAPALQPMLGHAAAKEAAGSPQLTKTFGSFRSPRRGRWVLLAVACSVAAVITIAVTLTAVTPPARKSGAQGDGTAAASFVGFRWRAIDVAHGSKHTRIPQRLAAIFGFSSDGTYTANYGYGGRYRVTTNGFRTYHVSVPFNLRGSINPTVAVLLAAAQAVSLASHGVTAQVHGQQLTLSVGTYRITCVRIGAQPDPPTQLPSSTSTPS